MQTNERIIDPALTRFLLSISPIELASISAVIGVIIASELTNSEQNVIGNFLQSVGQVMEVIAAQSSFISNKVTQKQDEINKQKESLKEEELNQKIENLEKQLNLLKEQYGNQLKL